MSSQMPAPEKAPGELRSKSADWAGPILDRTQQLSASLRAFRAFAVIGFALAITAIVVRPEAGLIIGGIYVVVLGVGLLAARLNLLD